MKRYAHTLELCSYTFLSIIFLPSGKAKSRPSGRLFHTLYSLSDLGGDFLTPPANPSSLSGVSHTPSAGIRSVRSWSGNHPPPTGRSHRTVFWTDEGALVFLLWICQYSFLPFPQSPPSVAVLYLLSYGFPASYSRPSFLVQASAVDDGLRFFIAAQHYQKVADHGGFALFVQIYDIIFI